LEASHGFANIWLKVPPSFDVSALPDFQPEACFGQAAGDNRRVKYLLLRRDRAPSRLQ
jgi:hypothetical protein